MSTYLRNNTIRQTFQADISLSSHSQGNIPHENETWT